MKILFANVNSLEIQYLEQFKIQHNYDIVISHENVNKIETSDFDIISCSMASKLNSDELKRFNKLKAIFTRSTGFDHIDLDYCKQNNILVANVPDYGDRTVAEFTILLTLAEIKKIIRKSIENEEINKEEITGNDINGKTFGIIGAGRIGTNVGIIAHSMGAKILYFNRSKNEVLDQLNSEHVDLDTLLSKSDIISIHLPLTNETRHLINKDNINKIKKGAIIINTARGAIIDTDALVIGLNNKIISGAGLDVIEFEEIEANEIDKIIKDEDKEKIKKLFENSTLNKFDNVIITPHIAYDTYEASERIIEETLDNINKFINNQEIKNKVI